MFSALGMKPIPTTFGTIVCETNTYTRRYLGQMDRCDSRGHLGFALLMEVNRLPQILLYWNCNPAVHYLPITEQITGDWLLVVWRYLHFTTNPQPSTLSSPPPKTGASSDPTHTQDGLWMFRPKMLAVVPHHVTASSGASNRWGNGGKIIHETILPEKASEPIF